VARRIPWLAAGWLLAGIAMLLLAPVVQRFPGLLPACPFKAATGIACATCGLTRCLLAVAGGRWAEAFHWHPVAAALVLCSPLAAGWDGWRAWQGRPYPGLPDHWLPRALAATTLLGTWALQALRGM
jgi:hypothetical protein